ncbi:MAG: phosphatidate cytidylyltransferase [Flavobacteriales bacterium]|nr:MAG: phosphatidate cytidylyltransferase [Flavobacteriales bacterium]
MTDLPKRLASGLTGLAILVGCILWSKYSFGAFFLLTTVFGLWEFYTLLEKGGYKPMKYFGVIVGIVVFCGNFIFAEKIAQGEPLPQALLLLIIPLGFLFFLVELFKKNENPFTNISFSFSGIIYIAFPFATLNYIAIYKGDNLADFYHPEMVLCYFLILWGNDTGAYFAGNLFGKHKLFERISPNKTWEGGIGGLLLAITVAIVISYYLTEISIFDWIAIAILIVFFGTLGDLVESYFKRGLGIKDSGNILPGHGGVLDRSDSLLLSVPFVYAYLRLFT